MNRSKIYFLVAGLISLLLYIWLSYFTVRSDFTILFALYTLVFAGYFVVIKYDDNSTLSFYTGLVLRLALLFSIPNLSDDFYRFIWDGKLIMKGINPLQYLPSELMEKFNADNFPLSAYLYQGMNSQQTYTCYPPFNQLLFYLGALASENHVLSSVIVMKSFILLADVGNFFLIRKLLKHFKFPEKRALLYWLNPLVIIELTGNMHYEGVMLFFILWAMYLLMHRKYLLSAIVFSLAVSVKLIPLLFLPALFWQMNYKKWITYSLIVMTITVLSFVPFFTRESILNFLSSLDLYFQKFEFNASIYYIVREIGYRIKGYNIIQTAGMVLMLVSFLSIVLIALYKQNQKTDRLFVRMLFILSTYYFLALIVHPWYVVTVLALSVFTRYRYPVFWTFLIFLSYFTYHTQQYQENLFLVFIEYAIVYTLLILEITKNAFYKKYVKRILAI